MGVDNRIRDLLREKGISQKQLAELTGVTESAVSHYISGDRVPRGNNLIKIAEALGTTVDVILGRSENNDKATDLDYARILLARNASEMTDEERISFIKLLTEKR
ncbi:MAG: helix-turn-helix domain-containing protein [Lachnospiraceae bacterium]|nr:helix-turn-helix domain-containing protein [Lachnospiraceae bacterium]